MRKLWLLPLAVGALHGSAIIRGTVVENDSSHPLARALVTLESVSGGPSQTVRCNSYGAFEFPPLPAGMYVVSAARLAFAPVQYGQKRWHSAGTPITLADNDATAVTIRLPRYGSITGTIFDENDVGLPAHEVAVYSDTRPPKLLARAKTDDRGMYRLFGLPPGRYLVRSLSKMFDETGYLPTFFRDTAAVDQARPVEVTLDQQVDRVDIHAAPGRLYTISGRVLSPGGVQAVVALASDVGTEYGNIDGNGYFQFNPMAPGQYELLASGADRSRNMAGFMTIGLDHEMSDMRISMSPLPTVQFSFEDTKGQPVDPRQLKVVARRKDIAGEQKPEMLQVVFDEKPPMQRTMARRAGTPDDSSNDPLRAISGKVSMLPGRWEVAMPPSSTYTVVSFTSPDGSARDNGRNDGWNEMILQNGTQNIVKFVVSSTPARLTGTVKRSGDPVAGIPVFLEPYDLDPAKRLSNIRSTRTNTQGQYSFGGLAPGVYRLLGTFEYQVPDSADLEAAGAKTVKVEEGSQTSFDLDEFVIH